MERKKTVKPILINTLAILMIANFIGRPWCLNLAKAMEDKASNAMINALHVMYSG